MLQTFRLVHSLVTTRNINRYERDGETFSARDAVAEVYLLL